MNKQNFNLIKLYVVTLNFKTRAMRDLFLHKCADELDDEHFAVVRKYKTSVKRKKVYHVVLQLQKRTILFVQRILNSLMEKQNETE